MATLYARVSRVRRVIPARISRLLRPGVLVAVPVPPDESENSKMDPTDFLRALVPGYADLSDEERSAITNFTLLWSAMEGRMIQSNANPVSLAEVVKALNAQGRLRPERFEKSLAYFRDRYVQAGSFNDRFEQLLFRKNDRRPLVEAVLSGNDADIEHVVLALLLIAYRLRNNLFHGMKWAYGIRGQQPNFEHAADILMRMLELQPP